MKEGFDKIDNSLQSVTETNTKINEDISHMRNEIIKNLVENDRKLQKNVDLLENKFCSLKENLECNNQYN